MDPLLSQPPDAPHGFISDKISDLQGIRSSRVEGLKADPWSFRPGLFSVFSVSNSPRFSFRNPSYVKQG